MGVGGSDMQSVCLCSGFRGLWDVLPMPHHQGHGFHTDTQILPLLLPSGTWPETMSVRLCPCVNGDGLLSRSRHPEPPEPAGVCAQARAGRLVVFSDRGACGSVLENGFLQSFLASLPGWPPESSFAPSPPTDPPGLCAGALPGLQLPRSYLRKRAS